MSETKSKWPEGNSKYAKKFRYLHRRVKGGSPIRLKFGFEVEEPKPWK